MSIKTHNSPDAVPGEDFDYEALPEGYGLGHNMMAGAFAGIAVGTHGDVSGRSYEGMLLRYLAIVGYADISPTRMQIISSGGTAYTGISNALATISRLEGFRTLFRGINSVIIGAGPAHGVYFATYEVVKDLAGGNAQDGKHHPFAAAASGACATIASDALMNPFDVTKQRMQAYGSTYPSIVACARSVFRNEGLSAFYVSYPTTLTMTVPFTAFQFMAYESLSKVMNPTKEYNPLTHCVAGGLAGGFAAGITTPLDVIKTLLQTRGLSQQENIRKASGLVEAAKIIKQQFGFSGFFRGLKPRIVTTMPSTAICWTSYEMAKAYFMRTLREDAASKAV